MDQLNLIQIGFLICESGLGLRRRLNPNPDEFVNAPVVYQRKYYNTGFALLLSLNKKFHYNYEYYYIQY
jgi:hypothetical protein